jgi:hypothetical protein
MTTARYLKRELQKAGITGVEQVDSATKLGRGEVIRRFAPFYNGSSSAELEREGISETRILISTDVLSEGLNLQDATCLINYDLHWNPVRLMQRIGRVDRRMNPAVEAALVAAHPECAPLRGKARFWNFLPPNDLDRLLALYHRVANKTLRISKLFGIEGRKLLRPDDDYEALRNFNEGYEGQQSFEEQMRQELRDLFLADPSLEARLDDLPRRIFSGKECPAHGARFVFFCHALPGRGPDGPDGEEVWTEEMGRTGWHLFDLQTKKIADDPAAILHLVRSARDTPRRTMLDRVTLREAMAAIEKHIRNGYLRQVQAPVGVKPILKAWMELN